MLFGKHEKTKNGPVTMAEDEPSQKETHPTKRRKPQNRSRLTRNNQVQIRLTTEEVATLKAAAKENDMTLADFVMSGIHQRRRIVVPGAAELRVELVRVGNNLNQSLRLAYIQQKEGQKIDIKSIDAAINQVEEIMDKLQDWLIMWDAYLTYKGKKGEQ